jgi:KUP system potassium uptake protein
MPERVNPSGTNATASIRRRSFNEAAHKLGDPPGHQSGEGGAAAAHRSSHLEAFLAALAVAQPPVRRVPGTAIFLSSADGETPPALEAEVGRDHTLADKVVIVSVQRVDGSSRDRTRTLSVEALGPGRFRILHMTIRTGHGDPVNVRGSLHLARKHGLLERNLDLEHAAYFTPLAADT